MCATCLGAIPVLTEVLGVSYDVALSMVIINGFFYTIHVLLGDPVVPGWVTPAIPIITAFLETYTLGPERYHALIATQFILGIIFLVFGITGLGSKMVEWVPNSVKAGVLMGGSGRVQGWRPLRHLHHLHHHRRHCGLLLPVQPHLGRNAPEKQDHRHHR